MTAGTTTLNLGAGGDSVLNDSLSTVDGAAAPASAKAQVVKMAYGAQSDAKMVSDSAPMPVAATAQSADYGPGYGGAPAGVMALTADPDGQLRTRSSVYTDERGFRANFANTSLAVALGSCTFTNGSATVSGTGFLAADLRGGDYVKLDADAESAWAQVDSIDSDTALSLAANYTGTGGTGASSRAIVKPTTGSGGSIAVASGVCTLTSGTTTASRTDIARDVDWLPLTKQAGVTVSQRIANQSITIGYSDASAPGTPKRFAHFLLDGTVNTTVKCQSGRNPTGAPSAAEIEETVVTLPNGATTATARRYRTEMLGDRVMFYIDGTLVATHYKSMPGPRDLMAAVVRIVNGTSPASSTTVTVDYMTVKNHNKLEVGMLSDAEPVIANSPPLTQFTYSASGVVAVNTVLMTIDCLQFRSISVHAVSVGTFGTVIAEWSNDGVNWVIPGAQQFNYATGAVATNGQFPTGALVICTVVGRYFRLRFNGATTAGNTSFVVYCASSEIGPRHTHTVGAQLVSQQVGSAAARWYAQISDGTNSPAIKAASTAAATTDPALVVAISPNANTAVNITQVGGAAASALGPATNLSNAIALTTAAFSGAQAAASDVSSAARTATGNSGAITDAAGGAISAVIVVSAVSGTSPTLDIALQESYDGGTTWVDIYHCERLTAAGTLIVPPIPLTGRRRWIWTIGGTTPSFTFGIGPTRGATQPLPVFRQFFDRTSGLINGTGTAAGTSFQVAGCTQLVGAINLGATTTPGTYKIQGSNNGSDWFDLAAAGAVSAAANSTILLPVDTNRLPVRFARIFNLGAGTTQAGNYASISGAN